MSTAFIFPGQGGQFIGQGCAWLESNPELKEILTLADKVSGRPITRLCLEGPLDELSRTANLQPAILAVSLMGLRLMKAQQKPDFTCGHSLGEFGALCAAEVLDEKTALTLVSHRAVLMDEAARKNPGAMLAVIGLTPEVLEGICELARNEGPVGLANFNTPDQIVISGSIRAISAAGKYVKMKNGHVIPLPLSGAFHSELMTEAAEKFATELASLDFHPPVCRVAPNATGEPTVDPIEIKARLLSQITSPVLWTKTIQNLARAGVTDFLEVWPKPYLTNIVKKCLPQKATFNVKAWA